MVLRGKLLFFSLLLVGIVALNEAGKKRGWNSQRRLRRMCSKQRNITDNATALEIHAFFDMRKKAFACLKITTCKSRPVCFLTSYPNLNKSAMNESTKWWDLLSYIQKDRKIEPISLTGWKGDKYKAMGLYIQNQPAIYRMCLNAMIYRFVHDGKKTGAQDNNSHVKRAINSSNSQSPSSTSQSKTTSGGIDPVSLCPVFKKEDKKSIIPLRYLFCQGSDCPCVRICVGQGRNRTNFHDCSTFRIICTFNCAESHKKQNIDPTIGIPSSTKSSQQKHKPSKSRKRRKRTNKSRKRTKRKSKVGKKSGKKQNKKHQQSKNG